MSIKYHYENYEELTTDNNYVPQWIEVGARISFNSELKNSMALTLFA